MNKELASKFVKYIVDMTSTLERKSSVSVEDVILLNRELDNFKKKIRDENGIHSGIYQALSPIRLELDDHHLEGNVINSILSFRKSLGVVGLFRMFDSKKLDNQVAFGLKEFKRRLKLFSCQFDEFSW
jgi:hypothetical protein